MCASDVVSWLFFSVFLLLALCLAPHLISACICTETQHISYCRHHSTVEHTSNLSRKYHKKHCGLKRMTKAIFLSENKHQSTEGSNAWNTLFIKTTSWYSQKKKNNREKHNKLFKESIQFRHEYFYEYSKAGWLFFPFFLLKQLFSELKIRQNSPPLSTHTHTHRSLEKKLGKHSGPKHSAVLQFPDRFMWRFFQRWRWQTRRRKNVSLNCWQAAAKFNQWNES